jgi:cell division protein FtsW
MAQKTKIKTHPADRTLLIIIFLLLGFGLMILASASTEVSREHFNKPYYYFFHQLVYGVGIGLIFFFVVQKISYKFWKKWAVVILALSIVALILVFVPSLGFGYGGAKRWVDLGFFSFQPSELVKLGFIIYLAAWLEKRKTEVRTFSQSTLPFLIIMGLIGILVVAQPDIGTLGVIVMIGIIIFFLAGAKIGHIFLIVLSGLATLFALIKIAPYRMNRLLVFLNPGIDPQGVGYQIKQALLAIGSGGLFGVGLGHSRQKYEYLPSPASDSIFAITAEELGFIGATILITLFLVLAIRGFKIARNSPDRFAQLTAVGITSWLVVQAFINIGAITGLIPLTGITLPFISYGASSMVMSLIGVGILINISKYTT